MSEKYAEATMANEFLPLNEAIKRLNYFNNSIGNKKMGSTELSRTQNFNVGRGKKIAASSFTYSLGKDKVCFIVSESGDIYLEEGIFPYTINIKNITKKSVLFYWKGDILTLFNRVIANP